MEHLPDTDLDTLKELLRHLRKESRRRGLPLSHIGRVKAVEEVVIPSVEKQRGLR